MKQQIINHFQGNFEPFYGRYVEKLKKSGDKQLIGLCPFHDEKNPSFSMSNQDGQYFCHSCREKGDAFSFYAKKKNLDISQDFPKILEGIASEFGISNGNTGEHKKKEPDATYNYVDEKGQVTCRKCKIIVPDGKNITWWERPNGNGKWIRGLNGTDPGLYNKPDVIKAKEVSILEGEKDVETAKRVGCTATTSPHGAGSWKDEYNEALKGKDIVLIPDNDKPGRKHMEQVARSLKGIANSIVWVDLPGIENIDGGDLSDWVAKFDPPDEAAESLAVMIGRADLYKPPNEDQANILPKQNIQELIPEGIFSDYTDYTKAFSESPVEFHVFTLAHIISSLIARGRYIQQGEDTIYPNLYTAIIAPSSLYKKSSSSGLYTKFLHRMDHLEGKFLGHIGSPEGLFSGLQDNKGTGFLYYSEMGSLLAATNKKWMVDIIDVLNDLYDCPNYYTKRLKDGAKSVTDVFLNLLCATQLDSMTAHIKESDLLSGFLPRFTTIYSENLRPHMVNRPVPDIKLQNKIMKQLNAIRQATSTIKPMALTAASWSLFENWAQDKHKEALLAPPMIQPMYGRLESHTLKYGIIIAIAQNTKALEIDEPDIKTAITWAEFVLNSYRRLVTEGLAFTEDDKKLKKVADIIKSKGKTGYRDVVVGTRYKPKELAEILGTLRAMGKIRDDSGLKGGKYYVWTG